MCNRFGSATYTLVLFIFSFILTLSSCVLIPYEPTPEVSLSADGHLPAGEMIVHVEPRDLLDKISEAIADADARIVVTDPVAFRDASFPDDDYRVLRLFEEGKARRVSTELGVDYLVLIGEMENATLSDVGHLGWFIGFFGAGYGEEEFRLLATIIDLQADHPLYDVSSSARGVGGGIGVFYLVAIYPKTESSVIEGLGRKIADTIINSEASEKVRIAVLGVENFNEDYALDAKDDVLLYEANIGNVAAELELYKRSLASGKPDFKWLCRAAEQGDYRARWRLGYLHNNGAYGVRKDLVLSYMWYSLVESDGHDPIGVDNIRKQLTSEQLTEAEHLYENWKPGRCEREILGTKPINTQ